MSFVFALELTLVGIVIAAAFLYRRARRSPVESAYQSLAIHDLNVSLDEERVCVCRDSLLDVLTTLSVVADGSVSYQSAVTSVVEARDMAELSSAALAVETVVQEFTPVLATHRAREQRNREMEELAEMWRGRLRTAPAATPEQDKRTALRSAFFGD
jgi:hypothetical protein